MLENINPAQKSGDSRHHIDNMPIQKSMSLTEDSISGIDFPAHISPSEFGLSAKDIPANLRESTNIIAETFHSHIILKKIFNSWIKIVRKSHNDQVNELNVIQCRNKRILRQYFNLLQERSRMYRKLHEIGEIIKMQRNFQLWKYFHAHESQLRQNYLVYLLKRRQIYEKSYFMQWKDRILLNKKANRQAQSYYIDLQQKAFNAFKINVKMAKNDIANAKSVRQITELYAQRVMWDKWRNKMRQKRLKKILIVRAKKTLLERYYEKWLEALRKRNQQKSKLTNIKLFAKHSLMRRFLYTWINRYNERMEVEDRALIFEEKYNHKSKEKFFYLWISQFNTSNYHSQCAASIVAIGHEIKVKHAFGIWLSRFHKIHNKKVSLENCEQKFIMYMQNKLFYKWKSKVYYTRYIRLKTARLQKRVNKIKLSSSFIRWKQLSRIKAEDEFNDKQAAQFRYLSLMMKVISRMKVFAEESKQERQKRIKAIKFRKSCLLVKAFTAWKREHRFIARQCFIVTAVLKAWSNQTMQKRFLIWRKFVEDKKNKRRLTQEAFDVYKSRSFQFVIKGFIFGASKKVTPFNPPKILQEIDFDSPSEDLLKSEDENIPTRPEEPKLSFAEAPKRPNFLPIK